MNDDGHELLNRLKRLNSIGVALSSEKDGKRLLERILEAARSLTGADGGTLYTKTEAGLNFEILLSESLGIHKGGTSGEPITFPPLPLEDEKGQSNLHMVAVCAAVKGYTINIPDAYEDTEFEFSGTRKFDAQMNYRSKSFLTVPMRDHQNAVIGVLQLINAIDPVTQEIRAFSHWDQELVESLASQAAVALVNQRFIEEQRHLFEAFIQLIANAIDDKSPYTGGHCKRVPELTMMLADAVARTQQGPPEIRDFQMSEENRYELWVAGMLHDCGKITTKEYVVDKGTKLETIFDRIHLIDTRFEVLKRDAEIALLQRQVQALQTGTPVDFAADAAALANTQALLNEERQFLRSANVGGEYMSDAAQARVQQIASRCWVGPDGQSMNLLLNDHDTEQRYYPLKTDEIRSPEDLRHSKGELENLCIPKGTLRPAERDHINHHITATLNMLNSLPYPKNLSQVPEFAGGHHERMDGKGYPKGLARDSMSLQARMMGIADIFEALTAGDRPYKHAMPLSQALKILSKMKAEQHIDPDLFDVFVREQVYQQYAKKYLHPAQLDTIDMQALLGA